MARPATGDNPPGSDEAPPAHTHGAARARARDGKRARPAAAGDERLSPRLHELTLSTSALAKPTKVRILLPAGYAAQREHSYPVLYLLHGASGDRTSWTSAGQGEAEQLTAKLPLIVVMPDGGLGGFYTNWFNNGAGGKPRWEDWHVKQLIPWVDRHYRTLDARRERAIAGLSMGGFGAFTYASRHPDLFTAALSLSGAVDPTTPPGVGPSVIDAISASDGAAPGSLWGPFATQEVRWRAHDPYDLAENLRGLALWLRTGNGQPGGPFGGGPTLDLIEAGVFAMATSVHTRLDGARHPARLRRATVPASTSGRIGTAGCAADAARDHAALPPRVAAARARHLPRRGAELRRIRMERAHEAAGDGVQPAVGAGRRGFTLTGSGSATVTTPSAYRRAVTPQGDRAGKTQQRARDPGRTAAHRGGLGPGNPMQQYTSRRQHARVQGARARSRPSAGAACANAARCAAARASASMSAFAGRLALHARALEQRRQALEARLGQEGRAAARAELAVAGRRVAVAVRAERRLRVVHVQAAQPVEPDERHAVVDHLARACRPCGCRSRWPAGGSESRQTPIRLSPPRQLDQVAQLVEGAAERVAGAGGVLEQQAAASRTRRAPRGTPRRRARAPRRAARRRSSRDGSPRRRRRSRRPSAARGSARRADLRAHLAVLGRPRLIR